MISKLKIDLENKQKHIAELKKLWEDKCAAEENLNKSNIIRSGSQRVAHQLPCLVNLNEDPSLGEWLMFDLPLGKTLVGNSQNKDDVVDIPLGGVLIQKIHCAVENTNNTVTIKPWHNAAVYVNGELLLLQSTLHHGDRVIFGGNHFFRFSAPGNKVFSTETKLRKVVDYEFARDEMISKLNQKNTRALQQELQSCRMKEREAQERLSEAEERIKILSNKLQERNCKEEYIKIDTEYDFKMPKTGDLIKELTEKVNKKIDSEVCPVPVQYNTYQPLNKENFKVYMLLQEANKISEALNKKIVFSHVVVDFDGKAEVLVRLNNLELNLSTTWNMELFQHKLQHMRELYYGESSDSGMEDECLFGSSEESWKKEYSFLSNTDLSSGYANSEGSLSSLGNHSMLSNSGTGVHEFENNVQYASLPSGPLTIQSELHTLISALSSPTPTPYYHCEMLLEAVRSLKTTTHRICDAGLNYLTQTHTGRSSIPVSECSSIRKLVPRLSRHAATLQRDVSHWCNHVITSDLYAPHSDSLSTLLSEATVDCLKTISRLMQGIEKSMIPIIEETNYKLTQYYDNIVYIAGQLCATSNVPQDTNLVNMSLTSAEGLDTSLSSVPSVPSDYGSNTLSHGEELLQTFTEGVREHYVKCLERSVESVKQCSLNTTFVNSVISENTNAMFSVLLKILFVTQAVQKKALLTKATNPHLPMKYFVIQTLTFDKDLLHKLEEISSGSRILCNSLTNQTGQLECIYHANILLSTKLQIYLQSYQSTFSIKSSSPKKQSKLGFKTEVSLSSADSDSYHSAKEDLHQDFWLDDDLSLMYSKFCVYSELVCRAIKPKQ